VLAGELPTDGGDASCVPGESGKIAAEFIRVRQVGGGGKNGEISACVGGGQLGDGQDLRLHPFRSVLAQG